MVRNGKRGDVARLRKDDVATAGTADDFPPEFSKRFYDVAWTRDGNSHLHGDFDLVNGDGKRHSLFGANL